MQIVAKEFSYNTGVVTRKQFDDHITLYKGYIAKTNEINQAELTEDDFAAANATYSRVRALGRGLTYAMSGTILHELYFENLGDRAVPVGPKAQFVFDKHFGGVGKWRTDFHAKAMAARGWCILAYEQRTGAFANFIADTHHDGNVVGMYPIVVLDMYEHAYFLDYGTDKAAYAERFAARIPWDQVEKRVARV